MGKLDNLLQELNRIEELTKLSERDLKFGYWHICKCCGKPNVIDVMYGIHFVPECKSCRGSTGIDCDTLTPDVLLENHKEHYEDILKYHDEQSYSLRMFYMKNYYEENRNC